MDAKYIAWLKSRGVKLFDAAGHPWMLYHRALVPATTAPIFLEPTQIEAKHLLQASGAALVRYSSNPCEEATEWWYIICDHYEPETFSKKTRQHINRGRRECRADIVDTEWLASHGYPCYRSAHSRYSGASPVAEADWRKEVLECIGGPVEFWGVFVGDDLAGYCKCVVEGSNVTTTSGKYDPAYFKHKPVNELVSVKGEHYVKDRGMTLSSGNRNIFHDTNNQDFLLHHGFRRRFCRLNIVYRAGLETVVRLTFPARRLLHRLPFESRTLLRLNALLAQEEIRRAAAASG